MDEPRLGLVLFNILNNAVKYTRQNDSVTIKAKLVRLDEMHDNIENFKRTHQDVHSQNLYTGSDASLSLMSAMAPLPPRESADYLKIVIKDTGLGMKEDVIRGLF